jgi:hypothetical protein
MDLTFFENDIFQQIFYVNDNFQDFLKILVQKIPKSFQNKHSIISHPKGWVWFMIYHLHLDIEQNMI